MEIKQQKKESINKWKIAFLVIIGIIIATSVFLYIRATAEREPDINTIMAQIKQADASFQIELNKSQANAIVNDYLTDFQKETSVKYEFVLEEQA